LVNIDNKIPSSPIWS